MCIYLFTSIREDIQNTIMDKQAHESIIGAVHLSKFLKNLPDIIQPFITPKLTDDKIYHDIVTKS